MVIKIGKRIIDDNNPCFIIAEAGVNHNGELKRAKKLVDAAVKTGADAIKFQTYKSENVVTDKIPIADYAEKNLGEKISQIDMLRKYELRFEDFISLKKYCDEKNIIFLSTPHSEDAVDFLDSLVPMFKIASGDLTNIPLLKKVAKKKKPIILGTGMGTITEIKKAIDVIKSKDNDQIIVLHCTTNYPCQLEEVNIRALLTMKKELNCLVGYSDHTLDFIAPIMAVTAGAIVLEKHFTTDRSLPGPDHKASLEPDELKNTIILIRKAEKALGNKTKQPTGAEKNILKYARKSIVATETIKQGEIVQMDMLTIKRPGTGIQPECIESIIGKKVKKDIEKDELISWEHLE